MNFGEYNGTFKNIVLSKSGVKSTTDSHTHNNNFKITKPNRFQQKRVFIQNSFWCTRTLLPVSASYFSWPTARHFFYLIGCSVAFALMLPSYALVFLPFDILFIFYYITIFWRFQPFCAFACYRGSLKFHPYYTYTRCVNSRTSQTRNTPE